MSTSNLTPSIVLTGFESAGKSALFRGLTGQAVGDETNFRGSTVICRRCHLAECQCDVVDTPGVRLRSDSDTTRRALAQVNRADVVLLVVRGTHAQSELENLLRELQTPLDERRAAIAITFEDKAPAEIVKLAEHYRQKLSVPVVLVNARDLSPAHRAALLAAIRAAAPASRAARALSFAFVPPVPTVNVTRTWFEHRVAGPLLALLALALLFVVPVISAFKLADWAQPLVDVRVIEPVKTALAGLPPLLNAMLVGNYGLLTLGWYSFLWAFPVVLFIGMATAAGEETGLHDRVTAALDPLLRRIGLTGRDLAPVLTGFGCNVVAIFQSRSCSACTRKSCVSLITFGSACSYQIGASLSLFGSGGKPWLFAPYLFAVFVVGAIHTQLWHGNLAREQASPLHERAFLQSPSWRGIGWRLRSVMKQFLWQAMPIFLGICAAAALLEYFGLMTRLANAISPLMNIFNLPSDVAPGIVFSMLRKDGLLTLNSDDGQLLRSLTTGQLFTLVYLGGTLTACLVTLWTVRKELGLAHALKLAGRQALTSTVTAALLAVIFKIF